MPYYVGIDIGEEKHQVCIMDTEGRVLSALSCKHTWAGLQKLKEMVVALGEININLERSNGLLTHLTQ
jgi:predicted NBD/HSP70 family sugar kinase